MLKTTKSKRVTLFRVEFDREKDGRWIAEVPSFPGALAYGTTKQKAARKAYGIALRTLADTVERGRIPAAVSELFVS